MNFTKYLLLFISEKYLSLHEKYNDFQITAWCVGRGNANYGAYLTLMKYNIEHQIFFNHGSDNTHMILITNTLCSVFCYLLFCYYFAVVTLFTCI